MSKKKGYTNKYLSWRIDQDYWYKLSKDEKRWLVKFHREYYRNQFDSLFNLHDLSAPKEYNLDYGKTKKGTVKQSLMYEEYIRRREIPHIPVNPMAIVVDDSGDTSVEDAIIEYLDKVYAKDSGKSSDK